MSFILLFVISVLTSTVSTYQLPSESKTCLLEKGIDYGSVQYDLENCVNNHTNDHELQNNIMHCVNAFEDQVQDCLFNEPSNELMNVQIQAVKKGLHQHHRQRMMKNDTEKSNVTSDIKCVFDLKSVNAKARNCTVKLKEELMKDCKLSEKGEGKLDFHWKPIGSESVNDYCKAENEKSLCIAITFNEGCPDRKLLSKYRQYFLCVYKTGTCKKMIDSNYIQLLPLKSQPKRPWMTHKSSVPAVLPQLSLYLLTLVFYVQFLLYT